MIEFSINLLWIKHGLWIIATLIWFGLNYFSKKETGYLSGLGQIMWFGATSIGYLIFWIIWLIIF